MCKLLIKCLIAILFISIIPIVYAKDIPVRGTPSFNRINEAYLVFQKSDVKSNDNAFYLYLKELGQQADNLNKYNAQDIQNWYNKSLKEKTKLTNKLKEFGLKIAESEGNGFYTVDYQSVYLKNKELISPQMNIWLEYNMNNDKLVDDFALLADIDKIRTNLALLEDFIKKNPKFVAKSEVIKELNYLAKIYVFDFDNTPAFDKETSLLNDKYKNSYEKFLKENKKSKFYKDISDYYQRIKKNNYKKIDSPNIKPQYVKNDLIKNLFNSTIIEYQVANAKKQAFQDSIHYINYVFEDFDKINDVEINSELKNIKNSSDAMKEDEQFLFESYDKFQKNKNNMAQNYEIYQTLKTYSKQYNEILEGLNNIYNSAYEQYKKTLENNYNNIFSKVKSTSYNTEKINLIKRAMYELNLYEFEQFEKDIVSYENKNNANLLFQARLLKNNFDTKAQEIYKYSYEYEKNNTLSFMKKNNRKIDGGAIAGFVYVALNNNPSPDCIYNYYDSSFPLYVFQTLNNGILVRGDYSLTGYYASTASNIFIQTSKKYVVNQRLKANTYYVFTGIKKYNTVLGAQNAVWQFKEISQQEAKNNFSIKNKLYFYRNF